MLKPDPSTQVSRYSLAPFGPAYGLREGSGTSTADDAGIGLAANLVSGAAWATTSDGPVVRLTNDGDWLVIPWTSEDPFEKNLAAFTMILGVKPSSLPGRAASGQQTSFFHRSIFSDISTFGIWNVGTTDHPGLIEGHLFADAVGLVVTPPGLELTAGTAYILVLRCQANSPLRLRAYDRSTGQQVGPELVSANSASTRVTTSSTGQPFLIGGYTGNGAKRTAPGDYDFLFFSPTYIADSALDTFVGDPFADYSGSGGTPPPAFDWLAAFESTMQWSATGRAHAYPQSSGYAANADDHYDPVNIFEQIRAYTGSDSWLPQIAAAVDHYREQGVFQGGGAVQGHHAYADGLLAHYERTGDTHSRDAAILVSQAAAGSWDGTNVANYLEQGGSREVAFSIKTKLATEALGCAHRPRLETQVAAALGHVAQWTAPPGQRLWMTFCRPFMAGLTMEALIDYWVVYRSAPDAGPGSPGNLAAQVPAAIKTMCDWLWANCWHGGPYRNGDGTNYPYGGFQYTYEDLRTKFDAVPSTITNATSGTRFCGGASLSAQNDFYKYAGIQFTSGPNAGQTYMCSGYAGSTREFRFDFGYSFGATPGVGDSFQVVYTSYPPSNGPSPDGGSGDTVSGASLNPLVAPGYAFAGWHDRVVLGLSTTPYPDQFEAIMAGSYTLRLDPVTQKLYNQTYKWAIKGVRWWQRTTAEYPAATGLTLAGPGSAGRVNAMSDRFMVALSGSGGPSFSAAAPVKVTPSDGGAGGTFFPASVVLTTERPKATFRYRPGSAGAKSISIANDRSLANPAAVPYTPVGTAPIATAITATLGQTSGPKGIPVGFDLALSPPAAAAPTTADPQGGLISVPLSVTPDGTICYSGQGPMYPPQCGWISSDNPSLGMTFTPSDQSPIAIACYNDGSLDNPPTRTFQVVAPTPIVALGILSATIDETGTMLTLDFPAAVTGGIGFTLSGEHCLNTPSGSAKSLTYQIEPVVLQNESLTLAYTPGEVADATNTSNRLGAFPAHSVVNNSIRQRTTPPKLPLVVPRHRTQSRPFGKFR